MQMRDSLPIEFSRVIGCQLCTEAHDPSLLRDAVENVPQPGYVGTRYEDKRVLLVGQNPGQCPPRLADRDAEYTLCLRAVRDNPSSPTFASLCAVAEHFIPEWPIHGRYFPLTESGLSLSQIAYCNIVRCRTRGNATPRAAVARRCLGIGSHDSR